MVRRIMVDATFFGEIAWMHVRTEAEDGVADALRQFDELMLKVYGPDWNRSSWHVTTVDIKERPDMAKYWKHHGAGGWIPESSPDSQGW